MPRSNVSFLVPTLNEEVNLPFALESCRFADRVFVLDSGSTDGTAEVARKFGAELVSHAWEGYARQKNWGLDNLPFETDWIFILDADEAVTPDLREEVLAVAAADPAATCAGYFVNRYFVWEGREIRHSGYYPSWNLRLFRRGRARYEERAVHEHMLVEGKTGFLRGEMRHEDRRGRAFLWQKHLRYADLEAAEMLRVLDRGRDPSKMRPSLFGDPLERRRAIKEYVWPHLPARWALRFFYMYFMKRGFMDGAAGLDMSLFMTRYEREIARRFRALRRAQR